MLVSLGYPDGEEIGINAFRQAIERISRVVSIPLSVDSLAGFGLTPKEVESSIRAVIESGAVGINIEDYDHKVKKLFPAEKQVEKLKAIKSLQNSTGISFVINARTDALRFAKGSNEEKFEEAVRRASLYRDMGVDCVYPMGLTKKVAMENFVRALDNFPTNMMIRRGLSSFKELEEIGVARVSFGPSASYAVMGFLKRISKQILEERNYSLLLDGAISFEELNSLE